ncbi:TIGR00266 family protein [Thiotrichales bacterium 19S3-7]|nr:TIGR00266 family protein [Thiotrichales bacterium 19S3-7]MCF6802818.1 TIGR00266 family protein [Thiotrichales bacterium 19S3-11]
MAADVIDYEIIGHDLQIVEVELDPNESVRAEAGTMLYMDREIEMQTNTGGGLFRGFKRMLTGAGFFITNFTNTGNRKAKVAFSAPFPGKIMPIDLNQHNGQLLCQKDAFLCAAGGIEVDMAFNRKLGSGFFGKEGFILQKLSGDGMSFIHAGGTIVKKVITEGDVLRVDAGCLVGFETSINFDIQFVGGFRNALFGGEGIFFAQMTGTGAVYIQSLPISRLADRMLAFANTDSNR